MDYTPTFHDIAHLAHVEILTPKPEASLDFFTKVIGLHVAGQSGDSVYLRAWGDYERATLKLTAAKTSGLGHIGFRTRSAQVLSQMVEYLNAKGVQGRWIENELGHGPAYRVADPDGHAVEIYFETERFAPTGDQVPGFKAMPQRYIPHGIAPKRLDHVNLLANDVKANREFYNGLLGMRVTEQIIFDDGTEMGCWLSSTFKSYDLAFTHDRSGAKGRFHHLTYFMDSREEVLKAADVLVEAGVPIETGPHKHNVGQTFFLYCFEPGGNRFEVAAGGYLIFDPEWKPVVWSEKERLKGQAWGLQTVHTFHTYGTPPVEVEPKNLAAPVDPA